MLIFLYLQQPWIGNNKYWLLNGFCFNDTNVQWFFLSSLVTKNWLIYCSEFWTEGIYLSVIFREKFCIDVDNIKKQSFFIFLFKPLWIDNCYKSVTDKHHGSLRILRNNNI